jgi:hypothetical protein
MRELSQEQRNAAIVKLEEFARMALDIIDEQGDIAITPIAEDVDAHRDVIIERGGSSVGGARVVDAVDAQLEARRRSQFQRVTAEDVQAVTPRRRRTRSNTPI